MEEWGEWPRQFQGRAELDHAAGLVSLGVCEREFGDTGELFLAGRGALQWSGMLMSRLLCQGIIGKRLATEFATCVVLTVRPGAASARRNANPFHFLDAYPPSLSTLSLISPLSLLLPPPADDLG